MVAKVYSSTPQFG